MARCKAFHKYSEWKKDKLGFKWLGGKDRWERHCIICGKKQLVFSKGRPTKELVSRIKVRKSKAIIERIPSYGRDRSSTKPESMASGYFRDQ